MDKFSSFENLSPLFGFGIHKKIADGIQYVDPDHILYVLGRRAVIESLTGKEMTFLPESDGKVKRITALAVPLSRKYLAISELLEHPSQSQVSVLTLATGKKVGGFKVGGSSEGSGVKELGGMCFSGDGRWLAGFAQAAQTSSLEGTSSFLETTIHYWNLDKPGFFATTKINENVSRISINPWNSTQLVTTGRRCLKMWKLTEGFLNGIQLPAKKDLHDYCENLWLVGGVLLVACLNGDVLLYHEGDFKGVIHSAIPKLEKTKSLVVAMKPCSKGFILADNAGQIAIYERNQEPKSPGNIKVEDFTAGQIIQSGEENSFLNSMVISPDEGSILCLFSNVKMKQIEFPADTFGMGDDPNNPDSEKGNKVQQSTVLKEWSWHAGAIRGMDVATLQPLIATAGKDKTVHIWNYQDFSCELVKQFHEEPLGIAIHPNGAVLAISFSTKVRIYSITMNDLIEEKELSCRSCKELRFSNGGHLLAAVVAHNIHIYSTITYEFQSVRGHTGQIRSLEWSKDDKKLVTVSSDGVTYEWSAHNWNRLHENVIKGCQYSCVSYNKASTEVLVTGSDGFVRTIAKGTVLEAELEHGQENVTHVSVLPTRYSSLLLLASNSGTIRWTGYPLEKKTSRGQSVSTFSGLNLHRGPVVGLRTALRKLVITAGQDGCIMIIQVEGAEHDVAEDNFNDLRLTSRASIDERESLIKESNRQIAELQSRNEYELRLKEVHFEEELRKVHLAGDERSQQELIKYEDLYKAKVSVEIAAQESLNNLEKEQLKATEEMELQYEKKLLDMNQRFEDLKNARDDMRFKFEEEARRAQEKTDAELKKMREECDQRVALEQEKLASTIKEMTFRKNEHLEEMAQQEEEYEFELAASQEKAAKVIQVERDNTMSLKGDNALLKRQNDHLQNEFLRLQNIMNDKDKEIYKSRKRIQELEETAEGLRKEVDERNFTIGQKENRILELKQKSQELEKYRFVLDYKINELKEELNPKDLMIGDMKTQIKEMDGELQRTLKSNDQLELTLGERGLRVESSSKENKELKQQILEKEKLIKLFVEDLHRLYTETEPAQWAVGIKQMYRTYVTQDSKRRVTREDKERMKELARQRQYMEHSQRILKEKAIRGEERMKVDVQRKVSENTAIISDVNNLRKENWTLKNQITKLENQLYSGSNQAAARVRSQVKEKAENNNTTRNNLPTIPSSPSRHSTPPKHLRSR